MVFFNRYQTWDEDKKYIFNLLVKGNFRHYNERL